MSAQAAVSPQDCSVDIFCCAFLSLGGLLIICISCLCFSVVNAREYFHLLPFSAQELSQEPLPSSVGIIAELIRQSPKSRDQGLHRMLTAYRLKNPGSFMGKFRSISGGQTESPFSFYPIIILAARKRRNRHWLKQTSLTLRSTCAHLKIIPFPTKFSIHFLSSIRPRLSFPFSGCSLHSHFYTCSQRHKHWDKMPEEILQARLTCTNGSLSFWTLTLWFIGRVWWGLKTPHWTRTRSRAIPG